MDAATWNAGTWGRHQALYLFGECLLAPAQTVALTVVPSRIAIPTASCCCSCVCSWSLFLLLFLSSCMFMSESCCPIPIEAIRAVIIAGGVDESKARQDLWRLLDGKWQAILPRKMMTGGTGGVMEPQPQPPARSGAMAWGSAAGAGFLFGGRAEDGRIGAPSRPPFPSSQHISWVFCMSRCPNLEFRGGHRHERCVDGERGRRVEARDRLGEESLPRQAAGAPRKASLSPPVLCGFTLFSGSMSVSPFRCWCR